MDQGRPHEIALSVVPVAPEAPAARGLAVGDEPMPFADMLAGCQPRQQVGVRRTGLLRPLDRRDQNSTTAALAEMIASTGMNRYPTTDSHSALAAITASSNIAPPPFGNSVSDLSSKYIILMIAM